MKAKKKNLAQDENKKIHQKAIKRSLFVIYSLFHLYCVKHSSSPTTNQPTYQPVSKQLVSSQPTSKQWSKKQEEGEFSHKTKWFNEIKENVSVSRGRNNSFNKSQSLLQQFATKHSTFLNCDCDDVTELLAISIKSSTELLLQKSWRKKGRKEGWK